MKLLEMHDAGGSCGYNRTSCVVEHVEHPLLHKQDDGNSTSSFKIATSWWFGTFFIFPYIGNNHPN